MGSSSSGMHWSDLRQDRSMMILRIYCSSNPVIISISKAFGGIRGCAGTFLKVLSISAYFTSKVPFPKDSTRTC